MSPRGIFCHKFAMKNYKVMQAKPRSRFQERLLLIEQESLRKQRQRSSLMVGERNCFYWMPHQRFSDRLIWRKGLIREKILCGMDDIEKYMNGFVWRKPDDPLFSKSSISPIIFCSIYPFLQIILGLNDSCGIQFQHTTSCDNLCLPFCLILILCFCYYDNCTCGNLTINARAGLRKNVPANLVTLSL